MWATWCATLLVVSQVMLAGQEHTLPAMAARAGGKGVHIAVNRGFAPTPFEEMARQADIVVLGTARRMRAYLSADERSIYTEYEVTPLEILAAGRVIGTVRQPEPGRSPLLVTQFGGQMQLNGVSVSVIDSKLPPFASGAKLVLFLTYDPSRDRYEISGAVSGAFSVSDNSISPLVTPADGYGYEKFRGMTMRDFKTAVLRARQR